jgi:WD40 repeat protein
VDGECDRFEAAWRAGARPHIEDFLGHVTAAGRAALLGHLMAVELDYRGRLGETPGASEYRRRFPGHEGLIDSVFAAAGPEARATRLLDTETVGLTRGAGSAPAWARMAPRGVFPVVPGTEILSELGRGGMGIVYKARQIRLNRLCALKMIHPGGFAGAEFRARFLAEAETVARLRHPNIVQIYALGEHDGQPYFEMEYVEGGSLDRRLDGTPWAPVPAARLVAVLARAIGDAHRLGIVHRDLKPANVLLTDDATPKIADFGLAKTLDADPGLTKSGVFVGTPNYAAPEQAEGLTGSVSPAADIYALGAIFYQLLTGRPPFQAATVSETLDQVRAADPVPPSRLQPGLPRDAETICLKCLHKDPQRRYADATALAEDLDRFLDGRTILARPAGAAEHLQKWLRRRPGVALLSALLAAAIVLGFTLVAWQWRRAEAKAAAAAAANERAQLARLVAFERQAQLTLHQALALCEQGEVGRGVLWLARSLELAGEARSESLLIPIRINLADWGGQLNRRLHRPPMRHSAPILDFAFGRDGKTLVVVSEDGVARIWDTATGKEVETPPENQGDPSAAGVEHARSCPGKRGRLGVIEESGRAPVLRTPDGRTVITGSLHGRVHLWDAETGRGFDLPPQGTEVTSLAVSPDGRVLASATAGGVVRLWNTSLLGPIGQTCKLVSAVTALAFDPHGRVLAIGDEDGTIRLWEVPHPNALGPPLRFNHPVQTVTFAEDGRHLLIGTAEGPVRCDLSGRRICALDQDRAGRLDDGPSRGIKATAVSPDGRTLAIARSSTTDGLTRGWVELRDAATARLLRQTPDQPGALSGVIYSPDSQRLLTWGAEPGSARLWDTASLQHARPMFRSLVSPINQAVFRRDGRRLLLGCRDAKARLWDVDRDVEMEPVHGPRHAYPITAVAFDPKRARLVTGCHAGTLRIWDATRGTMLNEMRENAGEIDVLAFSPDGKTLLTGSQDGTARFLDAVSGIQLGPALHHTDAVLCVAFHPDGRSVVTGTRDGIVQRWSTPAPPRTGAIAEIQRWAREQTGMELDDQGAVTMSSVCD